MPCLGYSSGLGCPSSRGLHVTHKPHLYTDSGGWWRCSRPAEVKASYDKSRYRKALKYEHVKVAKVIRLYRHRLWSMGRKHGIHSSLYITSFT